MRLQIIQAEITRAQTSISASFSTTQPAIKQTIYFTEYTLHEGLLTFLWYGALVLALPATFVLEIKTIEIDGKAVSSMGPDLVTKILKDEEQRAERQRITLMQEKMAEIEAEAKKIDQKAKRAARKAKQEV